MNTGIQAACNLGWKLALVARGTASETLLDPYDSEGRPAARRSLLLTHLIFVGEAADHPALEWARAALAPLIVPATVRLAWPRRLGLRTIGQLRVTYPTGALAVEGHPRLHGRPRAGARMPDAPLVRDGMPCRLHEALATPGFHLLLCGSTHGWDMRRVVSLQRRLGGFLVVHRISAEPGA